ncbi:RING finger protein 24-like [Papaver somniferum]|uniref:RING finger protein 24-like n=1 Tax=Papaver somniferum TaxID=3469 RepID=UPI000E6FCA84|nr:RING finger protein 24-like [Papaver somniferum]
MADVKDFVSRLDDDPTEDSEDFVSMEDDLTGSYHSEDSLFEAELEELDHQVYKESLEQEETESHMKKIVVLDGAEVCSVCLQDIDVGDEDTKILSCNSHIFHNKCMVEWSRKNPNCPLCRHDMRKERDRKLKRKRLPYDDDEELTRLKL